MGIGKLSKAGGLTAVALGLALTAAPASAQQRHGRDYDGQGGWRVEGGGDPREAGWRNRAESTGQMPAVRERERDSGRDWSQERAQAQQAQQAQAQAERRAEQRGGGQWLGRGRPDADVNGNQALRDAQRSQDWRQRRDQQQQVQRQGWRNGQSGDDWRRRQQNGQQYRQQGWHDGNRGEAWRGDRRHYTGNHQRWDNSWRRDRRYDWSSYRGTHRNVYRIGRYRSPYNNWSYRRLGIGFSLQPLFYSSSYWIDDPYTYRLPPAYGPYRWVRYYDDALLVNIYTGEVVDTIYNIFW
jgi:Nickel/cobalt transporter regulator